MIVAPAIAFPESLTTRPFSVLCASRRCSLVTTAEQNAGTRVSRHYGSVTSHESRVTIHFDQMTTTPQVCPTGRNSGGAPAARGYTSIPATACG